MNQNEKLNLFLNLELSNEKDICNINISTQLIRTMNHIISGMDNKNNHMIEEKEEKNENDDIIQYVSQFKIDNQTGYQIVIKK